MNMTLDRHSIDLDSLANSNLFCFLNITDMQIYTAILILFYFVGDVQSYPRAYRHKRSVMDTHNSSHVMDYLHQYGYVEDMSNMTDEKRQEALMEFQHFMGIQPSGEMDKETSDMMHLPRCGKPDIIKTRSKRYTFFGKRIWDKSEISFYVDKYTEDLKISVVNDELQRALDVWSEFTKIQFKPSRDDMMHGDINVTFLSYDGEGGVLGYAYKPTKGNVVFDVDEIWTKNTETGINLFQVAVHEFGHTLGLGHSDVKNAVMFPLYMGYMQNFSLHEDDIKGISALYKIFVRSKLAHSGDNTILCSNSKIDAIFTAPDGYLYLLKDDKYWKLTPEFIIVEGPKLIASRWPEVPNNVDAAFTAATNITYFFKGKFLWKYILDKKSGKSKLISVAFKGIPNDLDATFIWNGNGNIYFFKGENCWMLDVLKPDGMRVKYTYPHPISRWSGIPSHLHAAVSIGKSTYFFKGGKYYKYDDMKLLVDDGYPKNTANLFGCN